MRYESINPYTEALTASYPLTSDDELSEKIERLSSGFKPWSRLRFEERAQRFSKLAKQLETYETECATCITEEMGKPINEARREIQKCVRVIEYFIQETPNLLKSVSRPEVMIQPLGLVFGIMPWNFPFWQALRLIIPNLLMGNVCLIKHAPNVPKSIEMLVKLMIESGFSDAQINYAFLTNEQAADVIADPRIVGVSLTGSDKAGSAVGELAGKHIKPMVLELGGSDPFVVCEDADLDLVIPNAVAARFGNAGQVCISAKRFLIHERVKASFLTRFLEGVKSITLGDPLDPKTTMGPLARKDLQEQIAGQVSRSLDAGASLLYQAESIPDQGYFYPPTVLEVSNPNSPVLCEETFGPVAVIQTFSNDDEALTMANSSQYGLGASVWSQSEERIDFFTQGINAGGVFINQIVKSQPELPFGGIKRSGFGRELGVEGLLAFCNIKLAY